jgi:hypothetical protein
VVTRGHYLVVSSNLIVMLNSGDFQDGHYLNIRSPLIFSFFPKKKVRNNHRVAAIGIPLTVTTELPLII